MSTLTGLGAFYHSSLEGFRDLIWLLWRCRPKGGSRLKLSQGEESIHVTRFDEVMGAIRATFERWLGD